MSEVSTENTDGTVSNQDSTKQGISMANFIPDSLDFYFTFKEKYSYTKEEAVAKMTQAFGDYQEERGESSGDIRLFWKETSNSIWLDDKSLMFVFWFSGNEEEDKGKLDLFREKVANYIQIKGLPQAYTRFRASASGYFFPNDSADDEESSRESVIEFMKKLLPTEASNILDTSVEVTTKTENGKRTVVYAPARNRKTGISALGIEANRIISDNKGIPAADVVSYITSIDIQKDLADEREKIKKIR